MATSPNKRCDRVRPECAPGNCVILTCHTACLAPPDVTILRMHISSESLFPPSRRDSPSECPHPAPSFQLFKRIFWSRGLAGTFVLFHNCPIFPCLWAWKISPLQTHARNATNFVFLPPKSLLSRAFFAQSQHSPNFLQPHQEIRIPQKNRT